MEKSGASSGKPPPPVVGDLLALHCLGEKEMEEDSVLFFLLLFFLSHRRGWPPLLELSGAFPSFGVEVLKATAELDVSSWILFCACFPPPFPRMIPSYEKTRDSQAY